MCDTETLHRMHAKFETNVLTEVISIPIGAGMLHTTTLEGLAYQRCRLFLEI
jgi:hypothetical protein